MQHNTAAATAAVSSVLANNKQIATATHETT